MNSEKITQVVLGGMMILAAIAIGAFFIENNKQAAVEEALKNNNLQDKVKAAQFSVDNPDEPYKTLSLNEVDEMLNSGRKQMLFIGCRYCPHCQAFEPTIAEFIKKHGFDRDVVQKWEAGYRCFVEEGTEGYEQYERLSTKLIDGGVPQFLYIENGKIVDSLDGDRTVENLEKFFKKHSYKLQQ